MTVETILLNALGIFLTFYCAGYGFEAYRKEIREKIMKKNRELIADIGELLDNMKDK